MSSAASPSVVAVVVTWNRRDLMQESVAAVLAQTHPPIKVVVVDNASDDGTAEVLAQLSEDHRDLLDVVTLGDNTGGAGGFAAGMERAMRFAPDLVWLLDDDTVPTPDAAAGLVRAWVEHDPSGNRPHVLASKVVWTDGRDHPMNTPRRKPGTRRTETTAAEAVGAIPIRSASFVSMMCDARLVRERGFPIADYFLWNDDFEYSTRLIRGGVGLYVPSSVVVHKTRTFGSTDADPGERFFYEVRNKLWLFRRSRSLTAPEKALYTGSTVRRWVRTYRRSTDRATLRTALRRGLRAGVRERPRPNAEVLAGAGWPDRGAGHQPFSLLMSTWAGDEPAQLAAAYASSVDDQTRRPDEVVLVQDGPVPGELAETLAELVRNGAVPTRIVSLPENQGLGPALQAGLMACAHEIVARMDADDISAPERFEKQLPIIEAGADIVGSGL
ncbi:MAG TPA: glycosyltransferase, partial [Marmoricola sp.]